MVDSSQHVIGGGVVSGGGAVSGGGVVVGRGVSGGEVTLVLSTMNSMYKAFS